MSQPTDNTHGSPRLAGPLDRLSGRLFPGGDDDDLADSLHGHDAHFLERTARFDEPELERAMRLYHHSQVVRRLLPEQMKDHPARDRAAIALADTPPAAHVIVTRSGAFVTCLSAGMRVGSALVLPYSAFAAALEAEDAKHAQALTRRRQLSRLAPRDLVRALIGGPGELVREMVQVVEMQPLTYVIPVHIAFSSAVRRMLKVDKAHFLLLQAKRKNRDLQQRIWRQAREADGTAHHCLYLMSGMDVPELSDLLVQIVRDPNRLSEEAGAALAMHRGGGKGLLEIITDTEIEYLSRRVALQSLGHHFVYHPRNVPELAAGLLQADLGPDMVPPQLRHALELYSKCSPEHAENAAQVTLAQQPPPPQIPIEGAWILEGDTRNQLANLKQPISALFPPRELAGQVKVAWRRLLGVPLPLFVPPKGAPIVRAVPRVGRNAPCPCGSGAKYKQCCLGRPAQVVPAEQSFSTAGG